MKSENKTEFVPKDFTKNILIKSSNLECNDIGNQNKWIRNCPKCNGEIRYLSNKQRIRSEKNKSCCQSCANINKGKHLTREIKNKISNSKMGVSTWTDIRRNDHSIKMKKNTPMSINPMNIEEYRIKISLANSGKNNGMFGKKSYWYGKHLSEDTKNKIKRSLIGRKISEEVREKIGNSLFGKSRSEETKRKIRISHIKNWHKKSGIVSRPSSNPIACQFIDSYGKQNGYRFQHAMNGGEYHIKELGYFVDGYDKEKNVAFEYDEPRHFSGGKLKDKDLLRMNEIKNHLKCIFIRYNEKTKELKEF